MKRTQRVPKKGAIFVVVHGRYFIHDSYSVRYEQPLVKLNRLARQATGRGGVRDRSLFITWGGGGGVGGFWGGSLDF